MDRDRPNAQRPLTVSRNAFVTDAAFAMYTQPLKLKSFFIRGAQAKKVTDIVYGSSNLHLKKCQDEDDKWKLWSSADDAELNELFKSLHEQDIHVELPFHRFGLVTCPRCWRLGGPELFCTCRRALTQGGQPGHHTFPLFFNCKVLNEEDDVVMKATKKVSAGKELFWYYDVLQGRGKPDEIKTGAYSGPDSLERQGRGAESHTHSTKA